VTELLSLVGLSDVPAVLAQNKQPSSPGDLSALATAQSTPRNECQFTSFIKYNYSLHEISNTATDNNLGQKISSVNFL